MPPAKRPRLIFDGDCGFCRFWIRRWQLRAGELIDYVPSQACADEHPEIPRTEMSRAVQWVGVDGSRASGAAAVFEALAAAGGSGRALRSAYRHVPGFARVTETAYRFVAAHRKGFSLWTRLIWGSGEPVPKPPAFRKPAPGILLLVIVTAALLVGIFLRRRQFPKSLGGRSRSPRGGR